MKTDSIWHLPNKKPKFGNLIVQRLNNGIDVAFFWSDIKIDSIPNIPMHNVDKWCYFEDYQKEHQEQSSKIERLENALQDALDVIYERIGYRVDGIDELENILKKAIMENNNAE